MIMTPISYRTSYTIDSISKKDPSKKYYPQVCERESIDIRKLASTIALKSTMSTPDVIGVIEALLQEIPDLLLENNIVNLEGFGRFTLYVKSESCSNKDEVSAKMIKEVKMGFRPSPIIKKRLKEARFVKA